MASRPFPIVFIHTGTAPYVPMALLQAAHSNPGADIVLLGDGANKHLGSIVRHINAKKYWDRAFALAKVFKNYSSNAAAFELVCLQRWLCLLDWMQTEGHEACLYLDTDVLLYANAAEGMASFGQPGMTVSGISGHTNFIGRRETLLRFAHYIEDAYTMPNAQAILAAKFADFSRTHTAGGISDMTFFTEFRALNPAEVLDIAEPKDGVAYDITIDYTKYFEDANGLKKIEMRGGQPFATYRSTGQQVRMGTLHFQGASKAHMAQFFTGDADKLRAIERRNNLAVFIGKIKRKIFG